MQPTVASVLPGNGAAGALDDDLGFDDVAGLLDRGVGIGLQRHFAAAAQTFVGGDDDLGPATFNAARQGIRREAAKDDGVDRADAGASQHGVSGFRESSAYRW